MSVKHWTNCRAVQPGMTMQISDMVREAFAAFRPPKKLTVSEWADEKRQLSSEASAMPGRWRTRVVEFMREPMDCIGQPGISRVVIMAGAQVAKTEVLLNTIGYLIDHDPSPIMAVQPTLDMATAFSKDRVAPMVRDTRVLAKKVSDVNSRKSDNTIFQKKFPGGHLTMVGANSPSSLASRPIRAVLCDEVDRFPLSAGTEGDPIALAVKRTTTFWNRIVVFVSTPTVKGTSRIEAAYEEGDKRQRFCPCPHCGEYQVLKWSQIQWQKGDDGQHLPETAMYYCEECGAGWTDSQRIAAVRKGEWRATRPFNGIASFHVPGLISPFVTMADAVRDFLESKNDPSRLQVWTNTYLGETWEEQGKKVDSHELESRVEKYETEIPEDVTLLTCGIDVQDDRVEMEIVGWGDDHESWSIAYHVIYGDPSTQAFWDEVEEYRKFTYVHPLFGEIWAHRGCIDSGGHFTTQVYKYVRDKAPTLFAIKGIAGVGKPIVGKPSTANIGKIPLIPVGVHTAKELVLQRLAASEGEAGYCHFPENYGTEYFNQLTSEQLVTRYHKGYKKQEFVAMRKRNEAFDCRVYATAALEMTNVNLKSHRRNLLIQLEKRKQTEAEAVEKTKMQRRPIRKKTSFVDSWRDQD